MKIIQFLVLALVLFVCGVESGHSRFALPSAPQQGTFFRCTAISFFNGPVVYTCQCLSLNGSGNSSEYGPYSGVCVRWAALHDRGCSWGGVGDQCLK